jgi:hypothetical protein
VEFYTPGFLDCAINTEELTVLHEISHFQVSSPRRRLITNFGLGDDTWGTGGILSPEEQITEELRASVLTIFHAGFFGVEKEPFPLYFRFKGDLYKVSLEDEPYESEIDWLIDHQLLDHNLLPTANCRTKED